ncbi:MAG TPA: CvpA family protein, partial [Pseudonocardiaceae bacterium]
MNWVDVLVLVLALFAGVSGARQGMVTAVASFVGVLAGAVIGVRIAPALVAQVQSPAVRVAFGVTIVILLVALGETLGVWIGRAMRGWIDGLRLRQVDSALGFVVQGIAALVV